MSTNKLTNEEYWKKRADDTNAWLDKQETTTIDRLNQAYNEALFKTESKLYEFYGKYAEDNSISRKDAMKRLSGVDLSTYRDNAKRYREWADTSPSSAVKRWKRQLDEQYAASQVTRLDELKQAMYYETAKLNGTLDGVVRPHLTDVADYSYKTAFIAPSTTLNRPALEQIVDMPFKGYNYSDDLWGNTNRLATKLERTFRAGFTQGLSVREMAQEIRKDFNVQRRNAETVVRTDGNNIVNNATLKRYQDAGLNYARIHVNLDSRTTEICRQHDRENKLYTLEEAQGVLPAHYNCRSAFIPDRDELMEEHWEDKLVEDPLADDDLSWSDKIKAKVKQMEGSEWSLDDILEIGKALRETEFQKILAKDVKAEQAYNDAKQHYNDMSAEQKKMRTKYMNKEITSAEYDAVFDKLDEAYKEYLELFNKRHYKVNYSDDMVKMLKKVRKMGGEFSNPSPKSNSKIVERINNVFDWLPSDWADLMAESPLLARQKKGRSFHRAGNLDLKEKYIDEKKSPSIDDYGRVYGQVVLEPGGGENVALHEMMHAMEHRHAHITRLERAFYNKRTAGEELQRMRDVTGNNAYKPYEVTRVDDFVEAYMGRDYGRESFELLTMGIQYLYEGPGKLSADTEYIDFILGILLTQ